MHLLLFVLSDSEMQVLKKGAVNNLLAGRSLSRSVCQVYECRLIVILM